MVTGTHTPAWFYCFGSLAAPRLSTPFPAVPGSHHPPRRPPFVLPWGWTTRLYDLPSPLARLARTEVVNLHPALCLGSLFVSFASSASTPASFPGQLLRLHLLSLRLSVPRLVPPSLSSDQPASTDLPPASLQPHADTPNAPALSHRLSDTHARHRYRWMDTDTYPAHVYIYRVCVCVCVSARTYASQSRSTRVCTPTIFR